MKFFRIRNNKIFRDININQKKKIFLKKNKKIFFLYLLRKILKWNYFKNIS
jgi:hypothetical protein